VWEKLLCNCAYSGPCAVAECTIGEVMNDADLARVSAACATEGFAVARKKGVKLGFEDPVAYVREFGAKIPHARPSVLLDLMARRKSEIEVINGAIDGPVNQALTALVRAKERRLGCSS
jgi:2-dehydropantoate 2-reductase